MPFSMDPDRELTPKRLGAVMGLYDGPLHRDWLAWWTIGWTLVAGLSIAFPTQGTQRTSTLPLWIDVPLAAVVFGALFGVLPASVRRLVRRRRLRRQRAEVNERSAVTQKRSAPQSPPPSAQHVWPKEVAPPTAQPWGSTPSPRENPSTRPGPTPVNVLDTSGVRESEALLKARSSLPYPIARAARAVQLSTDMKDTYEATLRGAEAVSIVLGITAATWARDNGITTPELEQLKEALRGRGASQGHWQKAAKSIERPMYQHPAEIPGMVDALKTGKGGSGLVADLRELVEERNLWAHGGGPHSRMEAAERTGRFLPILERVLEKVAFLSAIPWILVNDVKLRRRERDFHVQAARAMGDHPDFDYQEMTTPQPLAEDVFYLLTPHSAVDLTPLVVMRQCPTCRQREVSYADRIDRKNGVALKTFDRGHLLFDAGLTEEMLALVSDVPSQNHEEAG